MAGNNAEIVFAGNAKGVLDEYKKLEKANDQLEQKLIASMKASKQAANEEKKLRQEVTQAIEKSRTPAEAYIATINRYKQALQQGMITADQFNRIRDKELAKLNSTKTATEATATSVKNLSTAQVTGTSASSKYANGFAVIATKALLAAQAVKALVSEQRRLRDEAEGTVSSVDELSRTYAIQFGLDDTQRVEARDQIMQVARKNAVMPDKAFAAATQLVSSGFTDPVKSGTLDSFLKIMGTSNLKGGDPQELAKAMSQFMGAYGIEKNQKTVLDMGVKMRGLFKDTDVQVSDLSAFAKAAPGLAAAKMPLDEALAHLTELRKTMEPSEAATGMRSVVSSLRSAWKIKEKSDVLKQVGIKPEQVDVVGESFTSALGTLKTAIEKQPPEKRAGYLTKLFGLETVNQAQVLMAGLGNIDANIKSMQDTKGFVAGVNMAQEGHNAMKARAEIDKQTAQLADEEAVTKKTVLLKEVEINRIERMRRQGVIKNVYDTVFQNPKDDLMNEIGAVSDQELLQRSTTGVQLFNGWTSEQQRAAANARLNKSGQEFTATELNARMQGDPQAAAMAEQTAVLKDIRNKLTPPPSPTVNPNLQGRPK